MIDLSELESEFRDKLIHVIRDCVAAGIDLNLEVGTLSAEDQSKLWRRSRSDVQIDHAIYDFREQKCTFLADILEKSNTSIGVCVTNDLPGLTWHNYGEQIETGLPHDSDKHLLLIKIAKKHDLTLGLSYAGNITIRKSPFVSPLEVYKLQEIDEIMQEKWGS